MTNNPFIKDFDSWNDYQKKLELRTSHLYDSNTKKYLFRQREIWYCSVGVNIGSEICGKNKDFERPVLILKKSGRHFVGLPLTSQKPNNPSFFYDISYKDKERLVESYVLINPLSFDVLRLQRKIRVLSHYKFEEIVEKTKQFFSLNIPPKNDPPV